MNELGHSHYDLGRSPPDSARTAAFTFVIWNRIKSALGRHHRPKLVICLPRFLQIWRFQSVGIFIMMSDDAQWNEIRARQCSGAEYGDCRVLRQDSAPILSSSQEILADVNGGRWHDRGCWHEHVSRTDQLQWVNQQFLRRKCTSTLTLWEGNIGVL